MVHIRGYESTSKKHAKRVSGQRLRARLLQLLDLDVDRFISGPILAEEVFIPRPAKCNYPMSSALEIRYEVHRIISCRILSSIIIISASLLQIARLSIDSRSPVAAYITSKGQSIDAIPPEALVEAHSLLAMD